jgi:peptidoglycan/LPS O-acetylase OafA/YrhL
VATFSYLDSLGLGALIAVLRDKLDARPVTLRIASRWLLVAGIALGGCFVVRNLVHARSDSSLLFETVVVPLPLTLVSFWLVAVASHALPPGSFAARIRHVLLESRGLRYIGRISYGMYLLQGPVGEYMQNHLSRSAPGGYGQVAMEFLSITLAVVAVASISWFMFESPINSLKRFFPYARPMPMNDQGNQRTKPNAILAITT